MFSSRLVHTFCSAPMLSILKPIKFGWNPNFNFILMYKCANTVQFHLSLWMKAVGKVFFVLLRITKHTVSWNKYKTFFFICTFLIRLVDSVYFLSTQFARTGFTDIVMRGLGSLNSMGQGPQSAVPMYNTNTLLNQLLCYGGGARTPIVSAHTYKARSWLNIESTHTLLWPVAFLGVGAMTPICLALCFDQNVPGDVPIMWRSLSGRGFVDFFWHTDTGGGRTH